MSEIKEFRLNIHHQRGQLWAEVEELPGCFASGRDMEELKEALEEAISLFDFQRFFERETTLAQEHENL